MRHDIIHAHQQVGYLLEHLRQSDGAAREVFAGALAAAARVAHDAHRRVTHPVLAQDEEGRALVGHETALFEEMLWRLDELHLGQVTHAAYNAMQTAADGAIERWLRFVEDCVLPTYRHASRAAPVAPAAKISWY